MKRFIDNIKSNNDFSGFMKRSTLRITYCVLLASFLLVPWYAFAEETTIDNPLIIYFSRTGKTRLVSETLKKHLNAHLLELQDTKDRSGTWGYMKSVIDVYSDTHSPILPEHPDIAPYSYIIVATPIWGWNLSIPIHSLFEKNSFEGKKVILITTANIHIMKYEQFGDDASFVKRFLKDYLRGKREAAVTEVSNSGANFVGHYHFATKDKTDEEIKDEALKCVEYIGKIISNTE